MMNVLPLDSIDAFPSVQNLFQCQCRLLHFSSQSLFFFDERLPDVLGDGIAFGFAPLATRDSITNIKLQPEIP